MKNIDETDKRILRRLQNDSSISLEKLAAALSISSNACWRRVKRLEEDGVILKRVALVSPERVGVEMTVFVAIRTNDHSQDWLLKFAAVASGIDEVVEIHRMAGEVDYLLKILVKSVADYDRVYKELIGSTPFADVSASFSMERIKYETAVPLT